MKLLFVHDHIFLKNQSNFYSDKLTYNVLSRYLKYFNKVEVFSRVNEVEDIPELSLSSGDNIKFKSGENINSINSLWSSRPRVKKQLENLIKTNDALVVRLPSEFGILAIDIAKKYNKPIYTEVVACAWDALWNYGKILAKLRAPLMFLQMRSAVKKSDYVIYVTDKFLQTRYPSNKKTIGISDVEISQLDKSILDMRLKKINYEDKRVMQIGLIGSFKTKYKGIHDAFNAISILSKKNIHVKFRILGSGDKDSYQNLAKKLQIEEKIHFDGLLSSGVEVWNWLDNIDIYIQPSYQEGLPRALVEAMSRACPAISSTAGGMPELLNGANLIKPGDYKNLAQLLEKGIKNKDWQILESNRNFEKSKEFQKEVLDLKRNTFLNQFKKFCEAK